MAGEVTRLLNQWKAGDRLALERLIPIVYEELRQVAARHLQGERREHTLQPTALVHESFLRLVKVSRIDWQCRTHFVAVAAEIMRRILVDHARARSAEKRGAGVTMVELTDDVSRFEERDFELLAIDEALTRFADVDPRQARIVELRFFGGMTIDETSEVLGLSPATIKREWTTARAWLRRELLRQS